jgi:hypothetical protein
MSAFVACGSFWRPSRGVSGAVADGTAGGVREILKLKMYLIKSETKCQFRRP